MTFWPVRFARTFRFRSHRENRVGENRVRRTFSLTSLSLTRGNSVGGGAEVGQGDVCLGGLAPDSNDVAVRDCQAADERCVSVRAATFSEAAPGWQLPLGDGFSSGSHRGCLPGGTVECWQSPHRG